MAYSAADIKGALPLNSLTATTSMTQPASGVALQCLAGGLTAIKSDGTLLPAAPAAHSFNTAAVTAGAAKFSMAVPAGFTVLIELKGVQLANAANTISCQGNVSGTIGATLAIPNAISGFHFAHAIAIPASGGDATVSFTVGGGDVQAGAIATVTVLA